MTTTLIRKKLISYIADANDKKVKDLYMLVEDEISKKGKFTLTNEHVQILEGDKEDHLKNKSKSYSWKESKEIIRGKREF